MTQNKLGKREWAALVWGGLAVLNIMLGIITNTTPFYFTGLILVFGGAITIFYYDFIQKSKLHNSGDVKT